MLKPIWKIHIYIIINILGKFIFLSSKVKYKNIFNFILILFYIRRASIKRFCSIAISTIFNCTFLSFFFDFMIPRYKVSFIAARALI